MSDEMKIAPAEVAERRIGAWVLETGVKPLEADWISVSFELKRLRRELADLGRQLSDARAEASRYKDHAAQRELEALTLGSQLAEKQEMLSEALKMLESCERGGELLADDLEEAQQEIGSLQMEAEAANAAADYQARMASEKQAEIEAMRPLFKLGLDNARHPMASPYNKELAKKYLESRKQP